MERGGDAQNVTAHSAVQDVQQTYGIPVLSIASLEDVLAYAESADDSDMAQYRQAIVDYRARYGVA